MMKKTRISPEKEYQIAHTQWERFSRARDNGHVDYVKMARRCDDVYQSKQWFDEDIKKLDDEKRPHLTVNLVLPTINAILGEQVTRKADFRVKAKKGTSSELAKVVQKVMNNVADTNDLHRKEAEVFADGLIMDGRGYYDVRVDFTKSIEGEIKIKCLDPTHVYLDPDAKEYDPKTWNEVIQSSWYTFEEVKERWGKQVGRKIEQLADNTGYYAEDSFEFEDKKFGNFENGPGVANFPSDSEPNTVRNVRIIERQHKKIAKCYYFIDPQTGDEQKAPYEWSQAKVNAFAKQNKLEVMDRFERRIRWTVTCDHLVLHDEWSPYDTFTVIPYFAYFRRGRPFGVIRNLLSSQEQLNKIASQELHIVNTTANSGWTVQAGSLVNMDAEDLERDGAKTGLVLEYAANANPPEKILPNPVPSGLDRIGMKAMDNIRNISGVNHAMLGSESPKVSGVAIQEKHNQGVVLLQVPLENLKYTRELLADKILNLVQKFYSEERVFNITADGVNDPNQDQEQLLVNFQNAIGEVVNNLTIGEYDIYVDTAPARGTFDEVQFAEAIALRQIGVAVPDDVLIRYSNLSDRDELAKRNRIETGVELSPEQQQMQEVQQQAMIATLELQVQQLAADIEKTKSEAALNAAKSQSEGLDPQIELAKMQTEYKARMEELELRKKLALIVHQGKMAAAESTVANKLATTSITAGLQKDIAEMNNATDLEQTIIQTESQERIAAATLDSQERIAEENAKAAAAKEKANASKAKSNKPAGKSKTKKAGAKTSAKRVGNSGGKGSKGRSK